MFGEIGKSGEAAEMIKVYKESPAVVFLRRTTEQSLSQALLRVLHMCDLEPLPQFLT
jgi:hypothetical protein